MAQAITVLEDKVRPSAGLIMSDTELLRFVNGMIIALSDALVQPVTDFKTAYRIMPAVMDRLAEQGMKATVGYRGTPIITEYPAQPHHMQ